ncbi:MAG: GntR family transcriptional regulator [Candidatus Woesearchaeota archaeon]
MNKIINDNFKLDKDTPIPLYFQLKELIKDQINNDQLSAGDLLPSERELAEHFNVSRPTIRQALKELAHEGLLSRQKGKGTFVAESKINYGFIQRLTTFYDDMEEKGYKLKTKVIEQKVQKPQKFIANKLNISEEEKIVFLKRIRYINKEPIVSVLNFLPYRLCPGLENEKLENKSLYKTVGEKYELVFHEADITLEPVVADQNDVNNLGVEIGAPIHLMKNITYDKNEIIFDYFISRFRGDKGKINVRLVNNDD